MTTSDKILVVHVDDNLSWNDHFHHALKKVLSYLGLLCKIKIYLTKEHRPLYYNSYMKSKKISNDQELIQSDPTSCPQNQKGNN